MVLQERDGTGHPDGASRSASFLHGPVYCLAQVARRPEDGHEAILDLDLFVRLRVARRSPPPVLNAKRAETTEFDPVSGRKGFCNDGEEPIENRFRLDTGQSRTGRDALDDL